MWKPLWEIWPLINRLWTCKVVRVSTECHPVILASAGEETASRSLSEWKLTQWPQKSHGAAGTRSHCPWGQMQRPELIPSTPQGHSGRLRILKFIRLCGGKPQTTKISGAPSKEAKAEIDVFLELSCFCHDQADVGNLISGSSAFSVLNWGQFTPSTSGDT